MIKTYEEEQNDILKFLINNNFYSFWRGEKKFIPHTDMGIMPPSLEFIITSACNKNCEYCYLTRYGEELYPKEIRDKDKILNNLKILLQYYRQQNFSIPKFDLFSGEIWQTDFGIEILVTILTELKMGADIGEVVIPTNGTFLLYPAKVVQIEKLIEEFKKYGTRLVLSFSIDGKYGEEDTRPFNNGTILNDEYYDKLFTFCRKYNYGVHPMMSAYNIENYKKNFQWFMEMLKSHNFLDDSKFYSDIYRFIMFLEVRNDDWTDEKILSYLDALNFSCDYDLERIWLKDQKGLEFLVSQLGRIAKIPENFEERTMNYINYMCFDNRGLPACTITYTLMVRGGDLAIVPCHRTSYKKFIFGNYVVEDNKIVDIQAQNPILANRIWNLKYKASPFCDSCYLYSYCMKGCYGSQYESNNDLFYPNNSCCSLFKAKEVFCYLKKKQLIEKYNLDEDTYSNLEQEKIINKIKEENGEKFNQWQMYIQKLLS